VLLPLYASKGAEVGRRLRAWQARCL
jgi:hypothetical protein